MTHSLSTTAADNPPAIYRKATLAIVVSKHLHEGRHDDGRGDNPRIDRPARHGPCRRDDTRGGAHGPAPVESAGCGSPGRWTGVVR